MKTSFKKIGIILGIIFIIAVCCSCSKEDLEENGTNFTSTQFYVNGVLLTNNSINNPFYTNGNNTLKIKSILQQKIQRNLTADVTIDLIENNQTFPIGSGYWMIGEIINTPIDEITYVHNISTLSYGKKYLFHVNYVGTSESDNIEFNFYLIRN